MWTNCRRVDANLQGKGLKETQGHDQFKGDVKGSVVNDVIIN